MNRSIPSCATWEVMEDTLIITINEFLGWRKPNRTLIVLLYGKILHGYDDWKVQKYWDQHFRVEITENGSTKRDWKISRASSVLDIV
jgi:hypothetical protein